MVCHSFGRNLREYYLKSVYGCFKGIIQEIIIIIIIIIDSIRKTAIFGASHVVQKVLESESRSLNCWDHCWLKRSQEENAYERNIIINNNNIKNRTKTQTKNTTEK
jgi:hypothetical protein